MWHKLIFLIAFWIFIPRVDWSQTTTKLIWQIPVDTDAIWDVDNIRYCYVYSNQNIRKIDPSGRTLLQASYKSLGDISKIDAQNPLKIAFFSEGQQKVCFMDNALALQNDCLDMSDLGAELVSAYSSSVQTDRIWIYDEPQSRLMLVTLRNNQSQLSQNVKSILDLGIVQNIQESENRLFVFDDKNQVLWFDLYGNFMDYVVIPNAEYIYPVGNHFLAVEGNVLNAYNIDGELTEKLTRFDLKNDKKILKLSINSDFLFLQTSTSLSCYQLIEQ